ncbi:hypothetical protein HYT52_04735 [Candidatus Woesearchaeota archaeon]|nr:hypothetical protein [Candidatus Woesearchaeota archaeon]
MSLAIEAIHQEFGRVLQYYRSLLDLSVQSDRDIVLMRGRCLQQRELEDLVLKGDVKADVKPNQKRTVGSDRNAGSSILDENFFSSTHFKDLKELHQRLSKLTIREGSLEALLQENREELSKNPLFSSERWKEEVRKMVRTNYFLALGAGVTGNYVPAGMALATALSTKTQRQENPYYLAFLYSATIVNTAVTIGSVIKDPLLSFCLSLAPAGLALFGLIRMVQKKEYADSHGKKEEEYKALFTFDVQRFERLGKTIDAGLRSVRYVENVCRSDNREIEDYRDQLEVLDELMRDYLLGGSEEALDQFSITYRPKEYVPKRRVTLPLSPARKNGYSAEDYQRLVESRELRFSDDSGHSTRDDEVPKPSAEPDLSEETSRFQVYLSHTVRGLLDEGYIQVDGISIEDLVESSIEKLQAKPRHEVIKEHRSNARFLASRLRERYQLPDDARIYKLRTRQGVRALYTLTDDSATILEIVDHREYERMMKNR